MSVLVPILIVLLTFAFGIVGFLYIKEQQKLRQKERLQKIKDLDTKIEQIRLALKLVPPRFLSASLRNFLTDQWLNFAHKQKKIESAYDNSSTLNAAREAKEAVRNNEETDEQKASVSDIEIASSIRRSLRSLHQIIADSYKSKQIEALDAKTYLDEVKKSFTSVLVEVYYSIAATAVRNQKYDLAAAQYDKMLQELLKNNSQGRHDEEIAKYRKVAEQLKEKALEKRSEEELAKPKTQEVSALEKQLDKMMEAEDEWKRKSEY